MFCYFSFFDQCIAIYMYMLRMVVVVVVGDSIYEVTK